MADQVSSLRIAVKVDGWADLNRLSNTFAQLRTEATARPAAVRAARAPPRAQTQQVQSMGERLGEQVGEQVIAPTLKAPFAIVRSAATLATRSVISIVGPMGKLATAGVAGTATLGAAALAVVAVGVPLFNLAATMRILRTSFGWAKEAADRQLTVLARTKKTFPGLTGDALRAAETRTGAKLRLASALFGEGAEALAEQITRRFTEVRMGKGLRGERDIFLRWGITPAAVQTFERARGGERVDLTDWLALFIAKREDLDRRQAATTEGSAQWRSIAMKRALLYDDSLKLFGQKFSDILGTWGTWDLARLKQNLQKATPLGAAGPGVDADQRARDFNIQLATTQTIFKQLKKGIAGDVMPTLTTMMDGLRDWLTDTEEGGKGMGRAFRNLGTALAVNAWQTMQALVEGIDPNEVKKFTTEMQSWNPQETLTNLASGVSALVKMVEVIAAITKLLTGAWGPQWLRRRVRGGAYRGGRPGPGEPGAGAPVTGATFAERWAGAGGGGGGAGYMGGGGPGGGSAGGGPSQQEVAAHRALQAAPEGKVPRYGTPQHQQWAQTPEYQEWAQQSPEFQQWQQQERAKGPAARLGPARFIRQGYAPPAPQAGTSAGGYGVQVKPNGMPDLSGVDPKNLPGMAQAALAGGGPAVFKYMKDKGTYQGGYWCGQFAAAVVKQAGGTPPKGYAIATNWRNWGQQVDMPQPGDVAVLRKARTGATGSHVTFVQSVDLKKGTVTLIGGNQGGTAASRRAGYASAYTRPIKSWTFHRGSVSGNPTTGEVSPPGVATGPQTGPQQQPPAPPAAAPGPTAPMPTAPAGEYRAAPRSQWGGEQYARPGGRALYQDGKKIAAAIRFNNPGAAWPSEHAKKWGMSDSQRLVKNKFGKYDYIAGFPTLVHGMASAIDLLRRKYVGKKFGGKGGVADTWSGGHRFSIGDFPANYVLKESDLRDPKFLRRFWTAMQKEESGKQYITDEQIEAGRRMYAAGSAAAYEKQVASGTGPTDTVTVTQPGPTGESERKADLEKFPLTKAGGRAALQAAKRKEQEVAGKDEATKAGPKEEAATGASDKDKTKEPVKAAGSDEEKKDKGESDDKKKKDLVKVELSDPVLMPKHLLETAKKHALESGPEGVNKFLSKWGVSRAKLDQPWCGKFAAAVVREHGLEPPKQFETASAWRNWGEKVETPEPGDIAVQIGKRQEAGGGKTPVPTLAPGSHVTIVETVDPKTGTMTTIGGNQALKPAQRYGKFAQTGRSTSPTAAFEYFRLPKQVEETVKEAEPAFDSGTKALLARREQQRKSLIDMPIRTRSMRRRAMEEGRAAGEAAADSFKRGIADTTIPIKSLREEDTQREQKREEREKEAA